MGSLGELGKFEKSGKLSGSLVARFSPSTVAQGHDLQLKLPKVFFMPNRSEAPNWGKRVAVAASVGILACAAITLGIDRVTNPAYQPSSTPASESPTATPTLGELYYLNGQDKATAFPTFGPTATPDTGDLKCDVKDLKHFHVPGVVSPIGREFGEALTQKFVDFYNSVWMNLGKPTLDSFSEYGLQHPAQILSVEKFNPETFAEYGKKVDLFFLDVRPMGDINKELAKLVGDLTPVFPNKTPDEIRIKLEKDFQIESVKPEKKKGEISVFAYMNAVDEKGNVFSYLTKYGKNLVDEWFSQSKVVDGKTVNGYNSLKNRQGFIVKVTVENGKVKAEDGFEGLRIDYDDFTEENCKTGSNNVAYPTKTPTPTGTVVVPTETPVTPPPGSTPTPKREVTPTWTPRPTETLPPTITPQHSGSTDVPKASPTAQSTNPPPTEPAPTYTPIYQLPTPVTPTPGAPTPTRQPTSPPPFSSEGQNSEYLRSLYNTNSALTGK